MWIRNESELRKSPYEMIRNWQIEFMNDYVQTQDETKEPQTKKMNAKIVGIAINNNEDALAVAYENNAIGISILRSIIESSSPAKVKYE